MSDIPPIYSVRAYEPPPPEDYLRKLTLAATDDRTALRGLADWVLERSWPTKSVAPSLSHAFSWLLTTSRFPGIRKSARFRERWFWSACRATSCAGWRADVTANPYAVLPLILLSAPPRVRQNVIALTFPSLHDAVAELARRLDCVRLVYSGAFVEEATDDGK